ncbi:cysteine synthase CysM [Neolewinella lacunae]|uniref:Cysteine synthase n=1 Tax=Neolewinella lacunae TaxID=1517758 RepID=A0A923PPQ1_9BACT|nr:cysteine synthase CysM [Neolewinella lacunae]MBC6995521.1 cysteine synthase CysM [Neolewinella lacunae]MDN3635109.1 cysteine synthase CysM [Neolewinella lacunae]
MQTLFSLVGNTPLVDLSDLVDNPAVQLFGKLEGQNPGGSVKDRAALSMLMGAWERGDLDGGKSIVEATSGNTGIALAMIAAKMRIPITLIMPDNSTVERVDAMRAYGAEVILTPAARTIEYSRELAQEMEDSGEYLQLNQFANDDNWLAHYRTTGPEIWRDTAGELTHFVSSMGTTGTITGTGRYLREQSDRVQIVGVQPTDGSNIPGIRRWSPGFLPKIYDDSVVHRKIDVSEAEAVETMRRLAREAGVFAGVSSGGSTAAAIRLADELEEGLIVCIICDRGDRYLSSGLYA